MSDSSLEWDTHASTSTFTYDVLNTAFYPLSYLDLDLAPGQVMNRDQVYTYSSVLPLNEETPMSDGANFQSEVDKPNEPSMHSTKLPRWISENIKRFKAKGQTDQQKGEPKDDKRADRKKRHR